MTTENGSEGRARPPGGPSGVTSAIPSRKSLNHLTPPWVRPGEMFFVTGCCEQRGQNYLCRPEVGHALLDTVRFYHERHDWFVRIFILMPDHFHALIAIAPDKKFGRLVGDRKRFTSVKHGIVWQKNVFEHRLRSDESSDLKADYIRANPGRAGLLKDGDAWPYSWENLPF